MSEIMATFIYRLQLTDFEMLHRDHTPFEVDVLDKHFAYLERLAGEGVVLLAGRTLTTDKTTFGIVIFEAASEAEAQRIMDNDPAVANGVMRAELFPFRIALARDGLEMPAPAEAQG
jgi:uncharacterized protein YciI